MARSPVSICITSGKGGVGKTSISVNLACALIKKNCKVLIIDGDLGLANVDLLLGVSVRKTIQDILENDLDPMQSVIFPYNNMGILPASSGVPEMVTMGSEERVKLGKILNSISSNFTHLIIDSAAGIGPSVLWFNNFADHNIVVLNSDPTSLTDAYALMKILSKKYSRNHLNLLVNSVSNDLEGPQTFENLSRVARKFLDLDLNYMGSIPNDKTVRDAVRNQVPFFEQAPNCKASRALSRFAENVLKLK